MQSEFESMVQRRFFASDLSDLVGLLIQVSRRCIHERLQGWHSRKAKTRWTL